MNFRELVNDVKTVLKLPLLLGLLFADFLVIVLFLYLIGLYGAYAVLGLIISQIGLIYVFLKELWRQLHMLPPSEAFETSPEKWQKAWEEYEKMVEKH